MKRPVGSRKQKTWVNARRIPIPTVLVYAYVRVAQQWALADKKRRNMYALSEASLHISSPLPLLSATGAGLCVGLNVGSTIEPHACASCFLSRVGVSFAKV